MNERAGGERGRGVTGWEAVFMVPAAAVALAILGYAYAWACAANPAALANFLLTIILVFCQGFIIIWMVRLSRMRHPGLAVPLGLALTILMIWAGFAALGHRAGTDGWSAWHARWEAGVSMIPGRWKLGTTTGWIVLVLESLLVLLTGGGVTGIESSRPFCTQCRTWARKSRWRVEMPSPPREQFKGMSDRRSLREVLDITPGGGKGTLRAWLGACKCGSMATLSLGWMSESAAANNDISDTLLEDLSLSPRGLVQVLEWGEAIDPRLASKRPTLAIAPRSSAPLGVAPKPQGPEWIGVSRVGWEGFSLGNVDEHDNAYTAAVRKRLQSGDYHIAEEAIQAQRHPDDRAFVAHACATWQNDQGFFEEWEIERPESAALHLTKGIAAVLEAWKSRGSGFKIKNPMQVMEVSRGAEMMLEHAAALAPDDPTALVWRMQALKTLPVGVRPIEETFAAVCALAPSHRLAHTIMLQCKMSKWFGSTKEMFEFANAAAHRAGPGSPLWVLLVLAHLEAGGEKAREGGSEKDVWAYLSDPGVGRELRAAHDKAFRSSAFRPTMDTPWVRSTFAYSLWKAGQKDAAAEHLRMLNPALTHVWFSPRAFFLSKHTMAKARRECGVGAGDAVAQG